MNTHTHLRLISSYFLSPTPSFSQSSKAERLPDIQVREGEALSFTPDMPDMRSNACDALSRKIQHCSPCPVLHDDAEWLPCIHWPPQCGLDPSTHCPRTRALGCRPRSAAMEGWKHSRGKDIHTFTFPFILIQLNGLSFWNLC